MTPPNTPPRRRNAQIRTYAKLLQCAVQRAEVAEPEEARQILRQLKAANARINRATCDTLAGIDTAGLVAAAHRILGFTAQSLLQPTGGER